MRFALGLEYDGAAYAGWQTQPGGRTVQDLLEQALARLATHPVATICAGRTDAGVHALDQVVHFDSDAPRPLSAWVRGVNAHLPASIAVRWARPVPPNFHARYAARARTYDYWILNDPVRSPLLAGRVGWVFRPLDAQAMGAAAQLLVGEHDFSSFRAAECQAASPVRVLHHSSVERQGRLLRVRIEANAFLHHMVRNIVGALVEVGLGRRPVEWIGQVLAARDRRVGARTMEPDGLYLARVAYDAALNLPTPASGPSFPCEPASRSVD